MRERTEISDSSQLTFWRPSTRTRGNNDHADPKRKVRQITGSPFHTEETRKVSLIVKSGSGPGRQVAQGKINHLRHRPRGRNGKQVGFLRTEQRRTQEEQTLFHAKKRSGSKTRCRRRGTWCDIPTQHITTTRTAITQGGGGLGAWLGIGPGCEGPCRSRHSFRACECAQLNQALA